MIVFVAGGSKGIGEAIVKEFCKSTENIIYFTYNKHKEEAEVIRKYILNSGNIPRMMHLDVTDREECINLKIDDNIDYLINNFGIVKDRTLKNMSDEEWDDVIDTNLTGIFNVTKALLPYMNNNGMIINITSVIGIIGGFGQVNYAASKAGVIGFTKALAKELAPRNIRVNAVACGFVKTDMTSNIPELIKAKIIERIPLGRFAEPKEIASFIYWLINNGSYVTGSIFTIDGGLT